MCFSLPRRGHRLFGNVIFFGKLIGVTTPLLSEVKKRRNTNQFTKMNKRGQRGGVRGAATQKVPSKSGTSQSKIHCDNEAAAKRKNHVVRSATSG